MHDYTDMNKYSNYTITNNVTLDDIWKEIVF